MGWPEPGIWDPGDECDIACKLSVGDDGQDAGPIGLFGWLLAILARLFG